MFCLRILEQKKAEQETKGNKHMSMSHRIE